ncbi:MAG: tRNA (N(6)-L-threonylcarbamoyladenosine(37)-C(2))-methylthiotransferase MtaB [Alphaproteobacteria bacterium]
MTGAHIITFGCRLNAYESEVIRRHVRGVGGRSAVVINTCAVTGEAERQARQAIRRARHAHPAARLIVTGCSAQIDPERYAAMPEVDLVLGNAEKLRAESYAGDPGQRILANDIMSARETAGHLIEGFEGRTRAFVQVQQGCDHRCTFCIIPYGRGRSRSVPMGEIAAQLNRLVANGYREAVVSGVDLTAYGADLPGQPTLGQMLRRVLRSVPGLSRLRLSSVDPAEVDDELLKLIAEEPRLMPHLHLSLQAGDDLVLKRMKRRHARADAIALVERVRALRPDVVFGADLIAGFPTETEEMFRNTLRIIDDCGLIYLHVFPYSPRPGTPAARMPQVPKAVRKARAARLRAAGADALGRHLTSRVGGYENVLLETTGLGRTEQFATVRLPEEGAGNPGDIVQARITGATALELIGELDARQAA